MRQSVRRSLRDRRKDTKVSFDPVYGERRIVTERRHARGPLLPTLYLLLELIMILLVIYAAKQLQIPILFYLSIGGGIYYFIASCLPRYRIVLRRQKFYLHPQKRADKSRF